MVLRPDEVVRYVMTGTPPVLTTIGPLISAGAVLLSASVAGVIALKNITTQRGIARRRATLDLISGKQWDNDYIRARKEFNALRESSNGLEFWAAAEHSGTPQLETIRLILNDYELIAIGISEDIIDETLYKRWFESTLIRDFDAAFATIDTLRRRTKIDGLYVEFEALARRWKTRKEQEPPPARPRFWRIVGGEWRDVPKSRPGSGGGPA